MKSIRYLAVLIAGLAMVTVAFGFGTMDHSMGMKDCPFAVVMGPECTGMATHNGAGMDHFGILTQLTTALGSTGAMTLLVIALFLFLAARVPLRSPPSMARMRMLLRSCIGRTTSPRRAALFWSALHNKCGDVMRRRVRGSVAIP